MELEVVLIAEREWYVCPVGGPRCGRVLVDFGRMGLDALDWHVRTAHQLVLPISPTSVRAKRTEPKAPATPEKQTRTPHERAS